MKGRESNCQFDFQPLKVGNCPNYLHVVGLSHLKAFDIGYNFFSPFEKCVFMLKSQVTLNELELNSTNIMCSSIINKYINYFNQCELLSLAEVNSFYNIKKNSKHHKPKKFRFVNYNKYKDIENWLRKVIL